MLSLDDLAIPRSQPETDGLATPPTIRFANTRPFPLRPDRSQGPNAGGITSYSRLTEIVAVRQQERLTTNRL
jgi:hypothetical protein